MSKATRYRMFIIKPAGMTSTQAVTRLGWNDRNQLKRYMMANNQHTAEIRTESGVIQITIKPIEEGKKK